MTEHEVTEQARAVLVRRLKVDPAAITPETNIEDLGVDSLDLVTLAGEFEEVFFDRHPHQRDHEDPDVR